MPCQCFFVIKIPEVIKVSYHSPIRNQHYSLPLLTEGTPPIQGGESFLHAFFVYITCM